MRASPLSGKFPPNKPWRSRRWPSPSNLRRSSTRSIHRNRCFGKTPSQAVDPSLTPRADEVPSHRARRRICRSPLAGAFGRRLDCPSMFGRHRRAPGISSGRPSGTRCLADMEYIGFLQSPSTKAIRMPGSRREAGAGAGCVTLSATVVFAPFYVEFFATRVAIRVPIARVAAPALKGRLGLWFCAPLALTDLRTIHACEVLTRIPPISSRTRGRRPIPARRCAPKIVALRSWWSRATRYHCGRPRASPGPPCAVFDASAGRGAPPHCTR